MSQAIDAEFGEGMTVTSAMKNLTWTTQDALTKLVLEDSADALGGRSVVFGLSSAEAPGQNFVCLPDSTQWNESFTRDDYVALIGKLLSGEYTVDDSCEILDKPETEISVDYQGTVILTLGPPVEP